MNQVADARAAFLDTAQGLAQMTMPLVIKNFLQGWLIIDSYPGAVIHIVGFIQLEEMFHHLLLSESDQWQLFGPEGHLCPVQ